MRVATIDIGTNTVLLLVADVEGGAVLPVRQELDVARLGQGVDAAGRLRPDAIGRVHAIVERFRRIAAERDVHALSCTATSAARDAANGAELIAALHSLPGVTVDVLSGDDEAWWSFRGALSGLPEIDAASVLDIGGGSTELVSGSRRGIDFHRSLDVGSVRYTERWLPSLPGAPDAVERLREAVAEQLATLPLDQLHHEPLIGVAGTITSAAALEAGLTAYEPDRIEGAWLPTARVRALRERLRSLDAQQTLALAPAVLRGRADVFLAGLCILEGVLDHFGLPGLRVSDRGLRFGWALRVAGQ